MQFRVIGTPRSVALKNRLTATTSALIPCCKAQLFEPTSISVHPLWSGRYRTDHARVAQRVAQRLRVFGC